MNYYISHGTFYAVPQRSNELYHYGVPGMKWGRRKARPVVTSNARRSSNATPEQQAAQREARKAKMKKAAKIGAAVAGTALAAYGAYKLGKFVRNKNVELATKRGEALAKKYYSENKHTVGWDGLGGIKVYQNKEVVGRSYGMRSDAEFRSVARTAGDLNRYHYNKAQGIKSRAIRDATNENFGAAAKNVGSHYANQAKQAIKSSKADKAVASAKAKNLARKAAEAERERLREEFIKRGAQSVLKRNTASY